jgi:predicted signal transduction protein with EAL and GGDEF domain
MGIATFGPGGQNESDLFEAADYALYQAKESAPCDPVFFNEAHNFAVRMLQSVDHNLRSGELGKEVSLVYQPIVLSNSRQLAGYEALARWHSPTLGEVSPSIFVAAAGKAGLSEQLTRLLFRKLLGDMAHVDPNVKVSFNLSSRDLSNAPSVLGLVRDIQTSGIAPRRLQFEISEQAVQIDFNRVAKSLTLLRNMGCSICLDNYGAGQSTLSYAYRLPISTIKIGGSFIAECVKDNRALSTLEAIISLCDKLDIDSVAVGIETEAQARLASDAGCMMLQGFHIARPMPPALIAESSFGLAAARA